MENLQKVKKLVSDLQKNVSSTKAQIEPVLTSVTPESLQPLEQAKHYALLAYSLDSLIFSYLKATGEETANHPITNELERIKRIMGTITKAEKTGPRPKKSTSAPERVSRIDSEAASRFIKHAIGSVKEPTNAGKKPDPNQFLNSVHRDAEEIQILNEKKSSDTQDENKKEPSVIEISDDSQSPEEAEAKKRKRTSKGKAINKKPKNK